MGPAAVGARVGGLSPQVRGSLVIITGSVFAGIIGPLARVLYDAGMTPFSFVVWRGIIAGAALGLLVWWRRRQDPAGRGLVFGRLPRRERWALLAFVISNIVLNTSLFVSFDLIPVAVALLLFYTYPVLLALYGRATGTEGLGPTKVAALLIALVGMGLVVTAQLDPTGATSLDPLGIVLGLVTSVAAAAWVGFGRACPSVPAEQAMGLALGSTVLVVGAFALVLGPIDALTLPLRQIDLWPVILVTGVVSGAGAAFLFTIGIRLIGRVRAGVLGLLEPIVGIAAAAVLLNELLVPIQLLGGALVLGAALLIQRATDEPPPDRAGRHADTPDVPEPGVV